MVTPRYFATEALSSSTLCKMYLAFRGLTFLVMCCLSASDHLLCMCYTFDLESGQLFFFGPVRNLREKVMQ